MRRSAPVLRVAMVGLGWAARRLWLPALDGHPMFRLVALVDPDPEAVRQARHWAPDVPAATLAEIDPQMVDLAVVAVPNHEHATTAGRLLDRGVAVFLEKPVCLTTEQARSLRLAEQAGGALLLAGSAARHRRDVQALAAEVDRLGPVRCLELSWVRASGVPGAGGWFSQRALAGGGALVDLGWHLLDIGLSLLGWPKVRDAVGTLSSDFIAQGRAGADWRDERTGDTAASDVEDTARGILVTEDGVAIILRVGWASHEEVDQTRIVVHAVRGSAELRCTFGLSPHRLPGSTLVVRQHGRARQVELPDEPVGSEYRYQIDGLPDLLDRPGLRGVAVAEAERTVAAVERLYDSARGFGQWPGRGGDGQ